MLSLKSLPFGLVLAWLAVLSAGHAHGVVLTWDSVAWPAGSLTNSFDVDPASPGNDITVSFADPSTILTQDVKFGPTTPAITNTLQGGLSPAHNSLLLSIQVTDSSQFITLTINFSPQYTQGVQNVSFSLFDIDMLTGKGAYQDQIRSISGLSTDGSTLIAPTITGVGSSVTLAGIGTAQTLTGNAVAADTGAGSNAGNATINFGSTALQSVTLIYGCGPGSPTVPGGQHISLDDISFSAVPEINFGWPCAILCSAAGVAAVCRQQRQ